jgi:hypothetical protein
MKKYDRIQGLSFALSFAGFALETVEAYYTSSNTLRSLVLSHLGALRYAYCRLLPGFLGRFFAAVILGLVTSVKCMV